MKAINKFSSWFCDWFTPFGMFSDYAKKYPKEFEEIIESLYLDRVVNWLSKLIRNDKD